ncbi:MAG: hypothetical protein OHK0032_19270 [Thermodesulfovibrionales bacterium]
MPLSVRLDKDTEELLEKASKRIGTTKSEVIKRSIREYCGLILENKKKSFYDFLKERIDKLPSSGREDLSIRHRKIIREMLQQKRKQGRV